MTITFPDDFSLAVKLSDTSAQLRAQANISHIIQPDGRAGLIHSQWNGLEILNGLQIPVARIMYSASPISMTEPPTSWLPRWIAERILASGRP